MNFSNQERFLDKTGIFRLSFCDDNCSYVKRGTSVYNLNLRGMETMQEKRREMIARMRRGVRGREKEPVIKNC